MDDSDLKVREFSDRDLGGTLMYLSPEQKLLNQRSSRQDLFGSLPREKVDIYAAGLVLFELCGQFKTEMERCLKVDDLKTKRIFPAGFEEKFNQESRVIL